MYKFLYSIQISIMTNEEKCKKIDIKKKWIEGQYQWMAEIRTLTKTLTCIQTIKDFDTFSDKSSNNDLQTFRQRLQ